jgi:DNA-binding NtrC family response regulator
VVIGRDVDCDVQIEDPQVSRSHATLHLGEAPRIEDLGSANGTQVRGRAIEAHGPVALGLGDPVQIGGHILVVQRSQLGERLRRVHGPAYLEARIEEECANASRGGGGFTLARIAIEGAAGHRGLAVLAAELRPTDIVAVYGGAVFGVLLVATPPEATRVIFERVERRMRESGMRARTAIAGCPRDGRSADALIGHVVAALEGRRDDGAAGAEVVASPKMRAIYHLAERIAQGEINVLLLGETGVGKDVLAQHLHRASSRAAGPFLRLNCASLSEALLESELFGHERGAFTGAAGAKPGLLETATGGTVFLDEVGELPLPIQAKLLQVIEVREVLRVGGLTPHPIDVRFVAATNRDLELQIERGAFRADLYYRLNGIAITIPPLRDRPEEILPLARHFLAGAKRTHAITDAAAHALQGYAWPGNARELRNVVERAALLAEDGPIDLEHLPLERMRSVLRVGTEVAVPPADPAPALTAEKAAERQRIVDALAECAGNQSHAARKLGIARTTLIARIEEYAIPRPRKR